MVDTEEGDGNGGGSEVVDITEDPKDKPIDEPKSEVKDKTKDYPFEEEKEEEKMEVTQEAEVNLNTLAAVASSEEKQ